MSKNLEFLYFETIQFSISRNKSVYRNNTHTIKMEKIKKRMQLTKCRKNKIKYFSLYKTRTH